MTIGDKLMGSTSKRMEGQIKEIEGKQEKKKAEVCAIVRSMEHSY
jgi:hypothetical protein